MLKKIVGIRWCLFNFARASLGPRVAIPFPISLGCGSTIRALLDISFPMGIGGDLGEIRAFPPQSPTIPGMGVSKGALKVLIRLLNK